MNIVAIDQEKDCFYITTLVKNKKSFSIKNLHVFKNTKEEKVFSSLEKNKRTFYVSAIDPEKTLSKELFVGVKKKSALKKLLPFQIESLTSMPPSECVFFPSFHEKTPSGFSLVFWITKKNVLSSHLQHMNRFSIDPDLVSSVPVALATFAKTFGEAKGPFLIFHLGFYRSLCVLVENEKAKNFHVLKIGSSNFLKALSSDRPSLEKGENLFFLEKMDFSLLNPSEFPSLFDCMQQFKKDFSKTELSLLKNQKNSSLPILMTGEIDLFPRLDRFLSKNDPFLLQNVSSKKDLPDLKKCAVSLGLGLEALSQEEQRVQFRQKEFLPAKQKKKLFFLFLGAFLFSSFFAFSLFSIGNFFLQEKKEVLSREIEKLSKLEKDFFSLPENASPLEKLSFLEKSLQEDSKNLSYFVPAPKISKIVSWLSSFPIDLQSFRFHLAERPKIENASAPFKVQIDLSFIASEKAAETFRTELLKTHAILSPQKLFSWKNPSLDHYQVSFFLNPSEL